MAFNFDYRTRISTFTVVAAIALGVACLPALAGEPLLSWHAYNGTIFVTGGVGEEELEEINAARGDFNVRLLMAEKSGPYVAGVHVVIVDASNSKILEVDGAGPYLLVRLGVGVYQLQVTYENRRQDRRLDVREGTSQAITFYW